MKILKSEEPNPPKWIVAWDCDRPHRNQIGRPAKIGRLPRGVRAELNCRLHHGESGASLAKWLNDLPESQSASPENSRYGKVIAADIADWKKGGYRDLRDQQERRMNNAHHCLAWVRRPEMRDKLFGRRQSWLEILNEMRRVFGRDPVDRADVPHDQDWDAIPTPKQRRTAVDGLFGLTPEGHYMDKESSTLGYFGPPRAKSTVKEKQTLKPQKP